MKIFKQGENYEEAPASETIDDTDGPVKDVGTEKEISADDKIKKICIYALGACVVFVVLVVLLKIGSNKSTDATTTEIGDSYTEEGAEAVDINAALCAAGDTSVGTVVTAPVTTEYSDEEAVNLRKWGYTADEIEFSRSNNISYDTLIQRATEQEQEAQKEALAAISDTASEEYKALLNSTYLGNPDVTFEEVLPDETGNIDITYETIIENVDYVKVGSKFPQLYVKLLSDTYGSIFMTLTPDRWLQLKDTGNIVIQYTVMHYGENDFVTTVSEVTDGIVQSKY